MGVYRDLFFIVGSLCELASQYVRSRRSQCNFHHCCPFTLSMNWPPMLDPIMARTVA